MIQFSFTLSSAWETVPTSSYKHLKKIENINVQITKKEVSLKTHRTKKTCASWNFSEKSSVFISKVLHDTVSSNWFAAFYLQTTDFKWPIMSQTSKWMP